MSFGSEFKEFAMKGNVIDLAVGVIIGGAFGKIVDSMVKDLIMPRSTWSPAARSTTRTNTGCCRARCPMAPR